MPLRKGGSDLVIRANIREILKSARRKGKPMSAKQAVAIANRMAGKKKPTKKDFRRQAAARLRKTMKA